MKLSKTRLTKSALSILLTLCMLVFYVTVGFIPTDAASIKGESVSSVATTVYFTPYYGNQGSGWIKDDKTILARYKKGNDWWDTKVASDTGRTITGKRVYSVTLYPEYDGLDDLYFRAGSSDSDYDQRDNEIHPFSSFTNRSTFVEKYYNGSGWSTPSYDTFKLKNNGNDLATFSKGSGLSYTTTADLTKGTTYNFNVYDGTHYWANNGAGELSANGSKQLYRYGSGGSGDGISFTPTFSGRYTFTWTLNDKGEREDGGELAITCPDVTTTFYVIKSTGSTNLHVWGTDSEGTKTNDLDNWPGKALSATETVNSREYYKVTFTSNEMFLKCIPNKSDGSVKSKDSDSFPAGDTYYVYWTGVNGTDVTVTTTALSAPKYQIGYRVSGTPESTNQHVDFNNGSAAVQLEDGKTYEYWIKYTIYPEQTFKNTDSGTMTRANCTNWTFSVNNNANTKITTSGSGTYYFSYTKSGDNLKVSVQYPHIITFDMNGHGSNIGVQYVSHGDTANVPTPPTEEGWTFDGWYTDANCTAGNEFNFSTAITADRTLYAKWTKNSHAVAYPAEGSRIGYTLSDATPSPVDYNDSVSFTVTPASGYRIKSVKYITSDNVEYTPTQSGTTYSFNMPDSNVTVSIEAVRIFTVTLVTQTKNLKGVIVDNVGFASKTYKIDNGSFESYTVELTIDKGSVVTFGVTYNSGYEYGGVTGATGSNGNTFTTAAISQNTTVTITAIETARTVYVKRRFTNANNSTSEGTTVQTLSVGITTKATVNAVPEADLKLSANPSQTDTEDYEFTAFTLPANNHIVGTPTGSASFEINMSSSADQSTYTIYIDYDEILHTLTLRVTPEGSGNIKKGDEIVTTLEVGNVTPVSLTAVPVTGYKLIRWEQEGSFSTLVPGGSEPNTTYSNVKISGDSTLTAVFEEIAYTVTLVRRIYPIDGDQVLSELENIYYHVGRYTPVTVSAPRVANSQFMNFTLDSSVSLAPEYNVNNSTIEITATGDATIYANYRSSGNISVYIDMNENIGTPILNFKYFVDSTGQPLGYTSYNSTTHEPEMPEGATVANLPCEMELVTGSESVYKYTVKLTKLRDDYKMGQHISGGSIVSDLIKISYITVENNKIGEDVGYLIDSVAYSTGEVWLKANSTNMKGFNIISYGSIRNTFVGLIGDGQPTTNHELLVSAINTVHGTGIHTDDEDVYYAQYAGLYTLNGSVLNNFNYTLNVNLNQQVTRNNQTYYFDKWVKCPSSYFVKNADNTYSFSNSEVLSLPTSDLNILKAPFATGETGVDYSYIALYKPVTDDNQSNVRVKITYHFNDYDTSDGNYVFDNNTDPDTNEYTKVTPATYTKYVTTEMTAYPESYDSTDVARLNVPYIKSNYFDYAFARAERTVVSSDEQTTLTDQKLILVDAYLTETARSYTILFNNGSEIKTKTGYYQNTVVLEAPSGINNPVWKMKVVKDDGTSEYVIVGTGSTFTARYMSLGTNANSTLNDCQVITVEDGSGTAVNYRSDIYNSFTEHYYSGDTEMLRHNFYIIDYCGEGQLVGGGVLYATTDGTDYRQANARAVLEAGNDHTAVENRLAFINSILSAPYDTEYKAQSINNVGFRYKPFKDTEDVYRYSDDMKAYLTVFEASNVNSENYNNQKLRMFSFMVYNTGTAQSPEYHVICSDGYAEVSRYIPQS